MFDRSTYREDSHIAIRFRVLNFQRKHGLNKSATKHKSQIMLEKARRTE